MKELLDKHDGFWWPKADRECRKFVTAWMVDLDHSVPLCKQKRVAVQAGGNVGTWPVALSKQFEKVISFEPDPLNFHCMELNCTASNIEIHQLGLGNEEATYGMQRDEKNIGAHYLIPGDEVKIIELDSMNLENVDFLCLDIEGFEYQACLGAEDTISRCQPVIHLEDKGLSTKYEIPQGKVIEYLEKKHGYKMVKHVHRDYIFVPS